MRGPQPEQTGWSDRQRRSGLAAPSTALPFSVQSPHRERAYNSDSSQDLALRRRIERIGRALYGEPELRQARFGILPVMDPVKICPSAPASSAQPRYSCGSVSLTGDVCCPAILGSDRLRGSQNLDVCISSWISRSIELQRAFRSTKRQKLLQLLRLRLEYNSLSSSGQSCSGQRRD
jgi:hypothetical protein